MYEWVEPIAAAVTAGATVALGYFTTVLARETKRLADVGEQPIIVVTLEPNRHIIFHLDLHVENTGTATAYDIQVSYSPPLKISHREASRDIPLRNISLLKPKQEVFSSLCDYGSLETKSFTITTSWRRHPTKGPREELSYAVDIAQMEGLSHLGGDPAVESANAAKKIADGIERISSGSNRLSVNTFSSEDRAEEERRMQEWHEKMRARSNPSAVQEGSPSEKPAIDDDGATPIPASD